MYQVISTPFLKGLTWHFLLNDCGSLVENQLATGIRLCSHLRVYLCQYNNASITGSLSYVSQSVSMLQVWKYVFLTGYSRGTCTPMFIVALSTIAKLWKQPRCPTTDKWKRKCGIYTQWNFMQPWRRMKYYHSRENEWNWRTSFWVRLAWSKRSKIVCSPSYVDISSRANTTRGLDFDHMIKREHTREGWG
jgi:hypothetical protein